jgi:ribosomal protein S17E
MDRVRRLSQEILVKYPGMFGTDYTANKLQLAKIATVHSKMIRNKLVGKITKAMIAASAEKEEEEAAAEVAEPSIEPTQAEAGAA